MHIFDMLHYVYFRIETNTLASINICKFLYLQNSKLPFFLKIVYIYMYEGNKKKVNIYLEAKSKVFPQTKTLANINT